MRGLLERSFLKFVIVGFGNTMLGLAIIYGLKWGASVDDVRANAAGYAMGVLVSFTLNKRWTFGHSGATAAAFARFIIVLAIAYLLNLATVLVALAAGINGYIAQALGIIPYTIFGYLGSKLIAFAEAGR